MRGRGPWRSRPFRYVWAGESLSMVGDASYQIAYVWLVLTVSHSPAVLAAVLIASSVARAALLLLGGAISDRVSARTVMLCSHLVRGVALTTLTTAALTSGLRVWELAGTGVLFGVADAFVGPASGSILPSLVCDPDLARANAMVGVSEQVASFVGPVVGGALLAATVPAVVLAFNAATFFVAALTILAAPKADRRSGQPASVSTVLADLRGGIDYAARNAEVRVVLLLVTAATLSCSGLFAVGLPTLARGMNGGPLVLGVMVSAWGLGQLVGALGASVTGLPRRWGSLVIGMTIAEGTSFAVLGFAPHYLLAASLLSLLGVGVAYSTDVALPTFIQTRTPPPLLGRVNSVITLPRFALEPVSIAAMGGLALLGVRWTFVLAAIPLLLVGMVLASSRTARELSAERPRIVADPPVGG